MLWFVEFVAKFACSFLEKEAKSGEEDDDKTTNNTTAAEDDEDEELPLFFVINKLVSALELRL